jgi:hypothetical protein
MFNEVISKIKIEVISAQHLKSLVGDIKDVVDPFVKVFIRGSDFDEKNNLPLITGVV